VARHEDTEREFEGFLQSLGQLPARVTYKYEKEQKPTGDMETTCEVACTFPYREITLSVYPCFFRLEADEQTRLLKHEAVHVLLWPMKHYRKNVKVFDEWEENICDTLSHVI
jgi:hypothetical protein